MRISTTKSSWTQLWGDLNVHLGKEDSWSREEVYKKDTLRLRRLGVGMDEVKEVINVLKEFQDSHKQFHRLVYLFAKDPDTVVRWTYSNSRSVAFVRISSKLKKLSRKLAKKELRNLLLLYELFRKREIMKYEAKHRDPISIKNISIREITSVLRSGEKVSGFKGEGFTSYNGFRVNSVSKKTGSLNKVYKFVLIKKIGNKVYVNLALDKSEERSKILNHLYKKYHIHIDRLSVKPRFNKFLNFMRNGETSKFTLSGAEFYERDERIAIFPKFGKPSNITKSQIYIDNIPSMQNDFFEKYYRLRLAYSGDWRTYVNLSLINYQNENIIGGVKISLNASGLNLSKRELIRETFNDDFGFQLDTPLILDVSEQEIYKKFLYNPPKKRKSIELVSNKTLVVAQTLKQHNLLPNPRPKEEEARICTRAGCAKRFLPQWIDDKICECGSELWTTGYVIVTQIIDEKKVRRFLKNICEADGFIVKNLDKKLVTREIYPLVVQKGDDSIVFIPVTSALSEDQMEILRYRYPNAVFVTSRDDVAAITNKNIVAVELYKLAFDLIKNNSKEKINSLFDRVLMNKNTQSDHLSTISASRLISDDWYLNKKSLGPEFFEADIYMLQNYIFKNSIWLGARERGKALPDTQSAFPVEDKGQRGCFISDAKFSKNDSPDIGSVEKNKRYINYGKANFFINKHGGLRGFTFISNKTSPNYFTSKMTKIIGGKYIMGSFMTVTQFLLIYEHLKKFESKFARDLRKLKIFLDALEEIFTKPTSYRKEDKIKIWNNDDVIEILYTAEHKYQNLK